MQEERYIQALQLQYDTFLYDESVMQVAIVEENGKIGVVDKELNIVIPLIYETLLLVEFETRRIVVQKDSLWMLIDQFNEVLFCSRHNYDNSLIGLMDYFDSSYRYVEYFDGYIEHYNKKIVLVTKDEKKEFFIEAESLFCIDNGPFALVYKENEKRLLDLRTGKLQSDRLFELPKKGFEILGAYEVDDILCAGEKPFSLLYQKKIVEELHNNGITTIITLMQESELTKYDKQDLGEFQVLYFPMKRETFPTMDLLYEIMYHINNSKKSYIYCNRGVKRVSLIIAYYLFKKYGYREETIFKKIQQLQATSKLPETTYNSQYLEFCKQFKI